MILNFQQGVYNYIVLRKRKKAVKRYFETGGWRGNSPSLGIHICLYQFKFYDLLPYSIVQADVTANMLLPQSTHILIASCYSDFINKYFYYSEYMILFPKYRINWNAMFYVHSSDCIMKLLWYSTSATSLAGMLLVSPSRMGDIDKSILNARSSWRHADCLEACNYSGLIIKKCINYKSNWSRCPWWWGVEGNYLLNCNIQIRTNRYSERLQCNSNWVSWGESGARSRAPAKRQPALQTNVIFQMDNKRISQ